MTFRPMPLLSLLAAAGLALLIALGSWQFSRMGEKAEALEAWEAAAARPAATLREALCPPEAAVAGRPVTETPEPAGDARVRIYGLSPAGAPGWRVFAPTRTPECLDAARLLMEVDFEPLDGSAAADAVTRPEGLRLARPARPGPFTPPAETGDEGLRLYAFERDAAANGLGLEPPALSGEWILARDAGGPPPELAATPPARHLGYALTWFGLAGVLVAMYVVFHARSGRLSLRGGRS